MNMSRKRRKPRSEAELKNDKVTNFVNDKIFSQDRQMIVDGFRHHNFCIWTIFG